MNSVLVRRPPRHLRDRGGRLAGSVVTKTMPSCPVSAAGKFASIFEDRFPPGVGSRRNRTSPEDPTRPSRVFPVV